MHHLSRGVWVTQLPTLTSGPQPPALIKVHYDYVHITFNGLPVIDLLMSHVHVLNKLPYCLMCTYRRGDRYEIFCME